MTATHWRTSSGERSGQPTRQPRTVRELAGLLAIIVVLYSAKRLEWGRKLGDRLLETLDLDERPGVFFAQQEPKPSHISPPRPHPAQGVGRTP